MKLSRRTFLKGIALAPLYFFLSSFLSKFRPWQENLANAKDPPRVNNVILKVMAETTFLMSGDGKVYFSIPPEWDGMNLVSVGAHVYTPAKEGEVKIQIHNATKGVDFLSQALTIEANKKDSAHSQVAAVINPRSDRVAEGDEIRIDVDSAGTDAQGLEVRLGFGKSPSTIL